MNIIHDVTRLLKNDKTDLLHILNHILVIIWMAWFTFNYIQNTRFEIKLIFLSVLQIILFLISWIHCMENKTISENQALHVFKICCAVQIIFAVLECACFCHLFNSNYLQSNSRVVKNGKNTFPRPSWCTHNIYCMVRMIIIRPVNGLYLFRENFTKQVLKFDFLHYYIDINKFS